MEAMPEELKFVADSIKIHSNVEMVWERERQSCYPGGIDRKWYRCSADAGVRTRAL